MPDLFSPKKISACFLEMTIHVLLSARYFSPSPFAHCLPSRFMLRLLMLPTNCNVQGTTANLPNVFHHTLCKERERKKDPRISEGSQDTFTCQETNGKAEGSSKSWKLWGLIHNHSAAKTFSADGSGQGICQYEGFWRVLIAGPRYVMMMLVGMGGNSVLVEQCHYRPTEFSIILTFVLQPSFVSLPLLPGINQRLYFPSPLMPPNCSWRQIIWGHVGCVDSSFTA